MNLRLDKWEARHRRNVAMYEKMIDDIYKEAVREAASLTPLLGGFDPDKPFSFSDYPATRQRVNNMLESLKNDMETTIVNGVQSEWTLANDKNNELCRRVFGDNVEKLTEEQYRRYFSNNDKARDAFLTRKERGLNLSDNVWKYTNQFKTEIEMGLDLGLRDGLSADEMSRELRQYLKYPDKLFRRVRDEHGNLHLSRQAEAFHPGRGVYRSSYKNARRLAATETNMAYRTSDYTRHQQLDFVVGIEVHLSGNHTLNGKPFEDICDDLAGKYPKDFKFTGWHPLCRCYTTTILKTPEEMDEDDRRIMAGEEPLPAGESRNFVKDVPEDFEKWIDKNRKRISEAKSLPYFIRDNQEKVDAILNPGQKPLTTSEKAKIRHDARTPEQVADIKQRYAERILLNNQISEVMAKAKEVGDTVQSIAVSIAQKYDAKCTPINYKSTASIRRKVNTERKDPFKSNFKPEDLKDVVRTTIITEKSLISPIINDLKGINGFFRDKIQNTELGYSGNIVNIKMGNGIIGEIQVNTAKMIYAKEKPEDAKRILGVDLWNKIRKETGIEGGLGHKYYEEWRVMTKTEQQSPMGKELLRKSIEYYSHFK